MKRKKNIRLSVVTCTYNPKAEHLEKALESIENQTFRDFEHVINDSFSNRVTTLIINDYIKRNKRKYPIKLIQTKPKGVAKAMNDASKVVSGEIVHFLHSDDYYLNNTSLERADKYFDEKTNWITGNFIFEFNGESHYIPMTKILKASPKRILSIFTTLSHENTFMRTRLIRKYGGFNEKVIGAVEYRLWLRMITKEHLKFIDDVFTVFLIHKGSKSRGTFKFALRTLKECLQILKEEKIRPFMSPKEALIFGKNKISVFSEKLTSKLFD